MSLVDVLCLHHPKDTEKSSVRALGGRKLNSVMEDMVSRISREHQYTRKHMAIDILHASPNSLWRWCGNDPKYPEGHPIPLWALKDCLGLLGQNLNLNLHVKIVRNITNLQCGRVAKTVRAVTSLEPELVQLCGAHSADGSLTLQHNRGPISSTWDLGDQELSNVLAVQKWIHNLFGIKYLRLPNRR